MAELTISSDEIRGALERYISSYSPEISREEVGIVVDAGDGIAHVEGLPSTMASELLEFDDGTLGVSLNLDVREIGVVILGDFAGIEEGQQVKRTGRVLSVPIGDKFLGRVVDPLGSPIDGLGEIENEGYRELELQAPNVMSRQPVKEPLQTGIKAIDSMTAIGRGQRELIIGDRKTGKTTVAIDTILNQRANWESGDPAKQVRCIYVAIGQKGSTIAAVKGTLEENGAMEYTTIVAAPASDPAGFKYLAPYTGSAIGQHWMYGGKHVLIVFDDLSKQAEAYRAVSLLLRRPPGREAYPGDVFYLHSRLLERCAKLSDEMGGGSMTGLPIIETKANDISAFIPTNVISITDGQIFLEADLFNQGVRPAINVGTSVSRVGGAAQVKPMKKVAGRLRLDLAQFRELEAFSAFASDLDKASRDQLERGGRLVELLKQSNYSPYPVEEQVVSVWMGTEGKIDDIAVGDVRRFEEQFLQYLRHAHQGVLAGDRGRRLGRRHRRLPRRGHCPLQADLSRQGRVNPSERGRGGGHGGGRRVPREDHARPAYAAEEAVGMAGQVRILRRRIRTTRSTKKITKAMELVATSRIAKAQARVAASRPYAVAITNVMTALASNANIDHPLLQPREVVRRAGVLVITSDRGLCGGYNANAIRTAEQLISRLREDGKQVTLYVVGRKGVTYYRFRNRPIEASWTGFSEQPTFADAREIGQTLIEAFVAGADDVDDEEGGSHGGADETLGVDELHLVHTQFRSLMTQTPVANFLAPLHVEEAEEEVAGPLPAYEFEPDPDALLDALLPKYINTRIYAALIDAAASESAARRKAMKSATDNAEEMIGKLTREMNSARQAAITQEISEIVGGANALAAAGSEV